jgi:ferredoxin
VITPLAGRVYRSYINDYCIVCGICVEVAPASFEMRERSVMVKRQPDRPEFLDDVREAQAACPVGAIVVDVWSPERRIAPR